MTHNTPQPPNPLHEALRTQATVVQRPLRSNAPFVGPLIAALRNVWYSVAARWGVQQVFDQQNEFNRLTLAALEDQQDQTEWLRLQDQQLTDQTRQIAELTARVKGLEMKIKALESLDDE